MSRSRPVFVARTLLVTRRVTRNSPFTPHGGSGAFLLLPGSFTNGLFLYSLGYAAARYGLAVHAFTVMTNHFHLVVTDYREELPAFMRWLDGFVARAMNRYWGRRESFWSQGEAETYNRVELLGLEAVLEKTVYVLNNPVAAGLVRHGRDWPGLRTREEAAFCGVYRVRRPSFFREGGEMPEWVELRLEPPPGVEGARGAVVEEEESLEPVEFEEFQAEFLESLLAEEERLAWDRLSAGKSFVGRRELLRQAAELCRGRARPEESGGTKPVVATRNPEWRKKWFERLREFQESYEEALRRYREGEHDAVFPEGTYQMRVLFGVSCDRRFSGGEAGVAATGPP